MNRKGKNLFWLTRSTLIGSKELLLFNREPYKIDWSFSPNSDKYHDKKIWFSCHGESYPGNNVCLTKFLDVDYKKAIPVKLVIDNDNPEMFIMRLRDNLFIDSFTHKVIYGSQGKEKIEVRHDFRISNKLFPEVTEALGVVGIRIERI